MPNPHINAQFEEAETKSTEKGKPKVDSNQTEPQVHGQY